MPPRRPPRRAPLVFVDTNVLLDLYRAEGASGLRLLDALLRRRQDLVTTEQVVHELRRNRVSVLASVVRGLAGGPERPPLPALLSPQEAARLAAADEALREARAALAARLKEVLFDADADPLCERFERYAARGGPLHLARSSPRFADVLERARVRMEMGNPPRKPSSPSIGDALNWEWCLEVAAEHDRDLVLVTRDGDFGLVLDGEGTLPNAFLSDEFRRRVGAHRELVVTPLLGEAARRVGARVPARALARELAEAPWLARRRGLDGA